MSREISTCILVSKITSSVKIIHNSRTNLYLEGSLDEFEGKARGSWRWDHPRMGPVGTWACTGQEKSKATTAHPQPSFPQDPGSGEVWLSPCPSPQLLVQKELKLIFKASLKSGHVRASISSTLSLLLCWHPKLLQLVALLLGQIIHVWKHKWQECTHTMEWLVSQQITMVDFIRLTFLIKARGSNITCVRGVNSGGGLGVRLTEVVTETCVSKDSPL